MNQSSLKTVQESDITIPMDMREQFLDLHRIMLSLKNGDISLALEYDLAMLIIPLLTLVNRWAHAHRDFLYKRSSSLEFHLHRSQYLRLILSEPPNVPEALAYAKTYLSPFFEHHGAELRRLMACLVWLPASRLAKSPYPDLAHPCVHSDLQGMFATEYCASLGMSRQAPLRVIGDIGGGGALARIEKGRKVMRERKSEWSQSDELPVRSFVSTSHAMTKVSSSRLKYPYLRRTDTILSLHVRSPRSRAQTRIPR